MAQCVPALLYCNLGDVTNLAVARGSTCLFTRISPFGVEGIAQRLAERRGLTLDHARQWLAHVGLERPASEIEGDRETWSPRRARRSRRAPRSSPTSCGSRSTSTAPRRARRPSSGIVALRARQHDPRALAERLERELGLPIRVGSARRPCLTSTTPRPRG